MDSVAVTGYFATGSGAVVDLLREYNSIDDGGLPGYEHLFLYTVDGVFDTIDYLTYRNNLFHSNIAIDRFRRRMKELNDIDYSWYGGLKYLCGDQFINAVERFITKITDHTSERDWYGKFQGRKTTVSRIIKDAGAVFLKGRRITHSFGTEIRILPNGGEYSFADQKRLNEAVLDLVNDYIEFLYPDKDGRTVLLNHFLLPQDTFRLDECLPPDMKMIIVDKDIRDLYIFNKYIWNEWGEKSFFPTNIEQFMSFTRAYRNTVKMIDHERILRVQFEDLIYYYDRELKRIEEFLGISRDSHTNIKKYFNPQKSIKNTQLFCLHDEWKQEVEPLTIAFPQLVYDFPYSIKTSVNETFDEVK